MIAEPTCFTRNCAHFLGIKSDDPENQVELRERPYCEAFPDGIPAEIAYGENDHTSSFPGDHGMQYEEGDPGVGDED